MKILKKITIVILLTFNVTLASASSVINFVWDIPTEREDGSPLPTIEISGYNLYEQGEKVAWIEGGDTTSISYDYGGYGQPCFTISTTDFWNQEGSQSPETCVNVFPAPPSAPVYLDTSK